MDTTLTYQLQLQDGTELTGKLKMDGGDSILIATGHGDQWVKGNSILLISPIATSEERFKHPQLDGEGVYLNPAGSHYCYQGSAMPKGKAYIKSTYILVNEVQLGISNNISIGGGFEAYSVLLSRGRRPSWFLRGEASAEIAEDLYIGANAMYINTNFRRTFSVQPERRDLLVCTGMATWGTTEKQLTGGLVMTIEEGEATPSVQFSGFHRFSKPIGVITDNLIGFGEGESSSILVGGRFVGETITFDLAYWRYGEPLEKTTAHLPWLSVAFHIQ